MKTVRQYVVDHHLPGCLPDRDTPVEPFTSEEEAIACFKDEVRRAVVDDLNVRQSGIEQELDAINIGLLLGMEVGEEMSVMVNEYRYYLGRIEDQGIPEQAKPVTPEARSLADSRKILMDELVEAIRDGRIEDARDIMRQIDELPHRTQVRQAKIEMIAGMFEYIRASWLLPLADLTQNELMHRNGYLHAILTAAGVPYAVAGEMRPSREWQSTFETVKLIALDADQDPYSNATWLVDLPKGKAAEPSQEDFAEQPRTTVAVESFAIGNRQGNVGIDYDRNDTEN